MALLFWLWFIDADRWSMSEFDVKAALQRRVAAMIRDHARRRIMKGAYKYWLRLIARN